MSMARSVCTVYRGYSVWWGSKADRGGAVGYDLNTGRMLATGATYNCPDLNKFVDFTMYGSDWPEGIRGRTECHLSATLLGLLHHLQAEKVVGPDYSYGDYSWVKQLNYMLDLYSRDDSNLGWKYSDQVLEKALSYFTQCLEYGLEAEHPIFAAGASRRLIAR